MRFINPKNWPIMVKVSVALLVASLIPAIFIAYYNLSGSLATVQNSEYGNLELLASATAQRLDQLMLDNVIASKQLAGNSGVIALVSDPGNASGTLEASVTGTLDHILASNPQYEYVYLMDAKGNVIISRQLPSVPTVEGQAFPDRAYFIEAMTGRTYIDVLVGRTSKKLGFYFSAPVLGANGQPVGVAAIKLQGAAITDIVNNFKAGNTGFAFLVDQDGVVVSSPEPGWNYQSLIPLARNVELSAGQRFVLNGCDNPQDLTNCKVASLNLSSLATAIATNENLRYTTFKSPTNGTLQIAGIASTTQLDWNVVVSQANQEFTAPLKKLAEQTAISVIVIGILVTILGIFLARAITQPLGKLAFAAHSVESGGTFRPELLAPVMGQSDEVGHLANVFSTMVGALNARVAELRTVNRVSRKISSSVDIAATLTLVLNSIKNVVPYDRASVLLYNAQKEEFTIRATSDKDGLHLFSVGDKPAIKRQFAGHLNRFLKRQTDSSATMLMPNVRPVPESDAIFELEWGDFTTKSYLGAPLQSGEQTFGAIELASATPGSLTLDHERVLELIAGQVAIAVRNALDVEQREAELRKQIDELQIEIDESKKQKYVSEIVESDFFQALTEKAKLIREQRAGHSTTENK
ncbi:MAG: cache domain-containing protein [Anaerolineales bacterium]